MHIRNLILTIFTTFAAVQMMAVSLPAADSLAVDTIMNNDPEWYVAPMTHDFTRAPFCAPAAACPIDSVRTFNVDSVLESVSVYEYGDTTRTMIWTVNPDGSRYGSGREESASTANSTYSATYAWDNTTNDWAGLSREEHYFVAGKDTAWLVYAWVDNAWVVNTKYTYVYDASGRETEFTTYERNAAGNLVYLNQRIREYNAAGRTTLDIQYTAHNGSDWSAGTKRIYDYDGNNTILNEYYSAYTNGAWVGSSKEMTTYVAGKKTNYVKQVWANSDWVNSLWEKWEFNGPSAKQTLHKKYSWTNNDWQITLQENTGFTGNNNTSVENYTYTNGVQKGTKKEEYTYSGSTKIATITYKWSNNDWVYNVWTVSDKVSNPNESCKYNWSATANAWIGTGARTLTTNNSSNKPIEVITQTWSTEVADWLNYTRKTTEYEGSKTTQEATYNWSVEANDWVGATRSDWHYNAKGQNDTTKTYTNNGTEWIYSNRKVTTYYSDGAENMVHNAQWNSENAKWEMTSMTRKDIIKDAAGRELLYAAWKCNADSVWIGLTKDSTFYTESGKPKYRIRCESWANNDWVPKYKIEYEYDDAERTLVQQQFDWVSGAWRGHYRYEYSYNEAGQQTKYATYNSWSTTYNNWVGTSKTESKYDEKGLMYESCDFVWKNNDWVSYQKYTDTRDNIDRVIEQLIRSYSNNNWTNVSKNEAGYTGDEQTKDNSYVWLNGAWVFNTRNETYNDDDAQAKLRRQVTGRWNSGKLISFADEHYFYACDPKLAFTIRFENEDGTLLESKQVNNGELPVYTGETPIKQADAQYTYAFAGWDAAPVAVTGDATYTATFSSTVNKYLITFKNGDETLQSTEVEYGVAPVYNGEQPAKQANAQYTYSFKGWDAELAAVTGEATYSAAFDSIVNTYLITFKNGESILQSTEVEYGVAPVYNGEQPAKQANAQYTYLFKGWDAEIVAVTGDATYSAAFDSIVNTYLITFKNGDETLQSTEVEYGVAPVYTGEMPSRPATAEYTYTFAGWDAELAEVTGEATYNATFSNTLNKYLITFKNGDETLQSSEVEYGSVPAYEGATPTKQADAQYSYAFAGWDAELAAVTGEATYSATFSNTLNKYLITFKNGDETLQSTEVEYGSVPAYEGATPTKQADAQYTYAFAGWDVEPIAVTGEATYNATFTPTQIGYTITWLNENGTLIDQTIVAYGTVPEHADATKENTAEFTYTFVGWDKPLSIVDGDATYTAVFSSVRNKYTITFLFDDGVTVMEAVEVEYGQTPATTITPSKIAEEHYYYHFIGWTPAVVPVTGEATYTAIFDTIPQEYLITFKNYNGTVLQKTNVPYGTMPEYTGATPTKPRTQQYSYEFVGWSPELTEVSGATTYTAQFEAILNQYTVVFLDEDGTELDRQVVDYGTKPVYQGETPVKAEDEQYTYTFAGWYPTVVTVTKDATYYATYTAHDKSQGLWGVQDGEPSSTKIIRNGTLYILRAGKTYTTEGTMVEQ